VTAGAPPASILVVRLGAIGDVVHGLPLLCRLRRAFPAARIGWVTDPHAAPVLEGHPALDELILLEKRRPLAWVEALRRIRARPFEVALDIQGLIASGLVTALSRAPRRLGWDIGRLREPLSAVAHNERVPPGDGGAPVVEQNLDFADRLGAARAPLEFRLSPRPEERERARALLDGATRGPYAAWVVGAGKEANRPFPETLAGAARALGAEGIYPLVLGGAEDAAEADAIAARAGGLSLAGRTTLRETLALLAGAEAAAGGDTGPIQMAAASGTPVVALFGGASPRRTGPQGAPVRVLWKGWACAPCFRRRCPIGRECLAAIGASEVASAVRALISEVAAATR
jgi:heptosyltransferase-1